MRVAYFVYYALMTILETLIRFFPVPTKTGYQKIGKPDENSPVLMTCNFHLTVLRLKKATIGLNYHLLIANSKGINVWCAAAGGHLNTNSLISIIKLSGIENKVNHKRIILPQLAATGIEASEIKKRIGWQVLWGPVHLKDLPMYFKLNFKKTETMRKVEFKLMNRIEVAVMWTFLASLFLMPIWGSLFKIEAVFLLAQIFFTYLLGLLTFPIYEKLLRSEIGEKKTFLNIGNLLVILINLLYASIGVILYAIVYKNNYSWILIRWSIVSFILVLVMNIDLKGSTPIYKSDSLGEKLYDVNIDLDKCRGTGICVEVCPRNCYELHIDQKIISMPRQKSCIQCGACIVQCPFDALYFMNSKGDIINPETVRKFKLNLMGKRN